MAWRWTARRWALSAFVLFHLSALAIWTMPDCAIKAQCFSSYRYYVLPLGLWQWWAIFAPDPIKQSTVLDAEVVDARGMRYTYEFPRLADRPWWQKLTRYRDCKFTANMLLEEYRAHRTFTARHAVRELIKEHRLGEDAFPLGVCLYIETMQTPTPGTGQADPMAQPNVSLLDRFQFASMKEVRP